MSEFNLLNAIDWQRSKAPILKKMLELKSNWYKENIQSAIFNWERDVFNLDTCNEFGLVVWAIVLNVPLYGVNKKSPVGFPAFGFGRLDDKTGQKNFARGSFGLLGDDAFDFTPEQKRIALKLKAYIISMSGSGRDINEKLAEIFGDGVLWLIDNLDMTISYVTRSKEIHIFTKELQRLDLLPRPASVEIRNVDYKESDIFGFGKQYKSFMRGRFKNA